MQTLYLMQNFWRMGLRGLHVKQTSVLTFSHTPSSSPFDIMLSSRYLHLPKNRKKVAQSGLSFLQRGLELQLEFCSFWFFLGGGFSPLIGLKTKSYYFSAIGKEMNYCKWRMNISQQINWTLYLRETKNKKTSTVLRTLTQTMYTKPSFHLETSLNPVALLAHTQHISPAFYWTAQQGGQSGNARTCSHFVEMPAIYLGRCFLRLNGRSSAEPRGAALPQT